VLLPLTLRILSAIFQAEPDDVRPLSVRVAEAFPDEIEWVSFALGSKLPSYQGSLYCPSIGTINVRLTSCRRETTEPLDRSANSAADAPACGFSPDLQHS
jgi:hypothetical protein